MRTAVVGMLILAPGITTADPPRPPERKAYTDDAAGYRVRFPAPPKTGTKDVATAAGVLHVTTTAADVGKHLTLSVAVTDYPEGFGNLSSKEVLDGVRTGLQGLDGKVAKEADVTVGAESLPGREMTVVAGGNAVRCRAFLVGRRLYQVTAAGKFPEVTADGAYRFLTSFELVSMK